MSYLDEWNAMSADSAADAALPCCGSQAWARGLASRRPLSTLPELLAASDAAWWSLPAVDWQKAFETHPRIGEQHAQTAVMDTSLQWSAGEQSSAMLSDDAAKARLAEGNRAYEAKFGRIYIVCATGKSAQEMLTILERRMHNNAEDELHESAEQQRQITHIRLRKWLTQKEEEQTA
ncbi:2-oxo-4-hydroxy-4-carboxy-5-ureidoimidazoline decarboxylase [Terriglobus roseus]|uniref:2-oxo-4-hydroxy-4-carboxy-5-ureidoimidazoline decarboxylase n=1 Tax=Terriglobus roseus TaxID=392734 RepID=A0A1H4KRH0_9BACT|nr:2-oxo-4-hydroxy-4-carboxy-5-ureidoimidazoline decarboxylase [Terriglobus roseus]SEB60698.1 2-oxo-4-hydroxy-4-carboxy-5-ureidoimidazoline decarboxylase [Terriglobus roseus]